MKKITLLLIIFTLTAFYGNAQFPIRIPKITKPKVEKTQRNETTNRNETRNESSQVNNAVSRNIPSAVSGENYDRQMVMDDAYTFFRAEVVKEYDSAERVQMDVGWYLKAGLRLMGTFPERSAFRVKVKQGGKQLADFRCEGDVETKAAHDKGRTASVRQKNPLLYDDYMKNNLYCFDKESVIKEVGELNVEVYFVNGDTDAEKLVRTYKIDVHKASNIRGNASKPQKAANDYYIQRHAESAVAFAYFNYGRDHNYYRNPVNSSQTSEARRTLYIHTSYSPEYRKYPPNNPYARCTLNGNRVDFSNYLRKDQVRTVNSTRNDVIGTYTDRLIPKYQRGNPYVDKVRFSDLIFQMPIYLGGREDTGDYLQIEKNPGNWECKIMANGETYRTFRWTVANGEIVPQSEQKSGNVNLFYDAALIDMDIPADGSKMDFRLKPLPNAGLFYGIPWTTAEGKKEAASVPTKGNLYEIPSNRQN